ncbi:MAG: hypothetical protein HQ495_15965 [Alphaproteobacteria bacterium]|nr:hypothetical protein [Alphaproteobacteria bacterium]
MSADIEAIKAELGLHGLLFRGGFNPDPGEMVATFGRRIGTVVLVGNAGSAMWRAFQVRPIASNGAPNPLNRWIEQVVDEVASGFSARAVYAHHGPPFLPFLTWAARSDAVFPSPLGLFVHPDFGLWHTYRAALLFDDPVVLPARDGRQSPCIVCADRPCTTACGVPGADLIRNHVLDCAGSDNVEGRACRSDGCAARRACPVGRAYEYEPHHMHFHMEAYLRSARR